MHPSMQDRKCLGHGQNVPINQSINRSINQSPRPGPSIYIAFPRPCSAMLQERCHGCCCHAGPRLSHAVQHMETRRRPAYYPAYCNRDSCIAGIQGLCAPLISIGCVTDLRKRKSSRFQATHLHSRKTVYLYRCTLAGELGELGHLHDACRRRRNAMMARSSWIV
jgi:hypothetical protein